MWAVGCLLLEMMIGKALWDLHNDLGAQSLENPHFTRDLVNRTFSHDSPNRYDPKLVSLLKKLLHPDPIYRLTVEEFFKKKFVRRQLNKINHERRR